MELRLAVRSLLAHPIISAAVALSGGLAIAFTTALFSVVDGLLFRPLPFNNPERLIAIDFTSADPSAASLAYLPELSDKRAALRLAVETSPLVADSAQAGFATFFDVEDAKDAGVNSTGVDSRFFGLLELSPVVGRTIEARDELHPALFDRTSVLPLPIVISHGLSLRLAGAPDQVLGIRELAGRKVEVVGVMAAGVKFPGETNVWAPVSRSRDRPPAYARLTAGATVDQLNGAIPQLAFKSVETSVRVRDARMVLALFAAGGLLVLATWVQMGALLFSLGLSRIREVGVQLALGATRHRLWRRMLIENSLLAAAAFLLGWIAVRPVNAAVIELLPSDLQFGNYLTPDTRTVVFACSAFLAGIVLLSAIPLAVLRHAHPQWLITGSLQENHIQALKIRRALVVVQMLLTTVLLYGCGLAVRSYVEARTFDYGFDAEGVLLFRPPAWARHGATSAEARHSFAERNRKLAASVVQLEGSPAVKSVSTFFAAPLGLGIDQDRLKNVPLTHFAGYPRQDLTVRMNAVGKRFVETLGAEILSGYSFDDPQFSGRADVVVINETLARRLLPPIDGANGPSLVPIIGREIQTEMSRGRIIGVIKDLVDTRPEIPADPQVFTRDLRGSSASLLAIRITDAPGAQAIVHSSLENIWGEFRRDNMDRLSNEVERVLAPYRAQSLLLTLIAVFAVPIAAVGLAGAVSYGIRTRSHELAVKIALGANPGRLRRVAVRDALLDVVIGIVAGLPIAVFFGRLVAQQLLGVLPADAMTSMAVAVLLLSICSLSAALSARSVSKLEPAVVLKER